MNINYDLTAPVLNIQSHCTHNGPGDRTTLFLKGCPLHCPWCSVPEARAAHPQLMTYADKCTACGKCLPTCPREAITVWKAGELGMELTDRTRCVHCGRCVDVCPTRAREIAGKTTTVRRAFDRLTQDKPFYDSSDDGGVTISGGEPLSHPHFTAHLLAACREEGIHTAVESSAFAPREAVDLVFAQTDLALLDIKHMDSSRHEELTGVPNGEILDNIRHIYHDLHVPVIIRVPCVPGCNDDEGNITATARFVAEELSPSVPVHLLPYHPLGVSKNESLGVTDPFSTHVPSDEQMQRLLDIVRSFGLEGQISG